MPISLRKGLFALLLLLLITPSTQAEESARSLYEKGVASLKAHQTEKALETLQKAVILAPEEGSYHWELGWAFWQNQDWRAVVTHWKETKRLTPNQEGLAKYLPLAEQYLADSQTKERYQLTSSAPTSPGEYTITAVGDIMMGSDLRGPDRLPPFEGTQLFAGVEEHLKGDIVFGNHEGTLTTHPSSTKCKPGSMCYAFRTPPTYAANLKEAGFNLINLANNHISDFGHQGLKDTIKALQANGLVHFGTHSKPYTTVNANGLKVGILGAGAFSCCLHVDQISKAQAIVRKLKTENDMVIVSFHAGAEGLKASNVPQGPEYFYGENRGDLRKFSHAMIDAGADLLLGHGPHTVRGLEIYKNKLIAYSLGNFLGYLGFNTSGHLKYTMILQTTFDQKGSLKSVRVLPLVLSAHVIPSLDPKGRVITLLNRLSREDFGENGVMLDAEGRWKP